jgi:tRNA dimethylallyltransferase
MRDMAQSPDLLPPAILVAGPTASGKSALALALAERLGGVVINADSMQVYRELRIVTARPDDADLARAPHALYGVRPAAEAGTVAWWRQAALAEMQAARAAGRVPILCGGTGMYFAALTEGLAAIPPVPAPARRRSRRAGRRCWPKARWRRCGRWARSGSIRRCRRCVRMGCRSCCRIWPGG